MTKPEIDKPLRQIYQIGSLLRQAGQNVIPAQAGIQFRVHICDI
jgi:hypothetical protein